MTKPEAKVKVTYLLDVADTSARTSPVTSFLSLRLPRSAFRAAAEIVSASTSREPTVPEPSITENVEPVTGNEPLTLAEPSTMTSADEAMPKLKVPFVVCAASMLTSTQSATVWPAGTTIGSPVKVIRALSSLKVTTLPWRIPDASKIMTPLKLEFKLNAPRVTLNPVTLTSPAPAVRLSFVTLLYADPSGRVAAAGESDAKETARPDPTGTVVPVPVP